jgi:serine/threonine-protein kinase TTK/MPS1
MLMAVNTVHEAKIVHCDLKPANFLLVQGTLKLIDFGISKAIMNDTTNIVRDNQVGTVNYMSPEALQETSISTHDHRGRLKIGRPSDIWSLGCILYEMTFGKPPFAQFTTLIQRLHKILDPGYEIEFPPNYPNSDLIGVIKGCLQRPPKERLTLSQLFNHSFLKPSNNSLNSNDKVLITRDQIYNLLEKFSEAYPGINPALLTDRIFQQWKK